MTGPLGDLERANYPMDPASLRTRRVNHKTTPRLGQNRGEEP